MVGERDSLELPLFPPRPFSLSPQQVTLPSSRRAQVCWNFEESAVAFRPCPSDSTSCGTAVSEVEPPPSIPRVPLPQHATDPCDRRAHVCSSPAESATAFRLNGNEATWVGESASSKLPLPSCPFDPPPQQTVEPLSRMAHVWSEPEAMALALRFRPSVSVSTGTAEPVTPGFPS